MRFFIDTEFIQHDGQIDLVSIGCVAENGYTFYEESNEYDPDKASAWVQENVFPYLNSNRIPLELIRKDFRAFVDMLTKGESPEFWGDYCAYDYVVVSQLMGTMEDWPENWPFYFNDLRQLAWQLQRITPEYPSNHNALDDARNIKRAWEQVSQPEPIKTFECGRCSGQTPIDSRFCSQCGDADPTSIPF